MFDTYVTKQAAPYPQTITEIKAPTDDSIRIYKELKEKVTSELLACFRTKDNGFECTWHLFDRPEIQGAILVCRFSLNGHDHQVKIDIDDRMTTDEVAQKINKVLTESLSVIMIRYINEGLRNELSKGQGHGSYK
ncbi:MAG: hypothetical protein M0R80_13350 [Proteobacteria bacterium]|jgi:hypothetical protein|nr:hypothetical protein [Pseudomonadota bacterium]